MSKEPKKKSNPIVRFFRFLLTLVLIVVLAVVALFVYLTVTEFKPAERVAVDVEGKAAYTLSEGDTFKIVTWNIGYGALGDNADFFMDGGSHVYTATLNRVKLNMAGILEGLADMDPDIVFLQEVDRDSTRSKHIDEYELVQSILVEQQSSFANNFKVAFIPYPMPPIGKVDSGLATFSSYPVASSERVQLPIPFSWPVRMANLKRCVLISRVPLEGSDKELVLMNLHLEAYDSGEGKVAQTKMLAELLQAEAEKGNYVIAGGDFNQIFSSADVNAYPNLGGEWTPGLIDVASIDGDWQFLMDASHPSCRSLRTPLKGANPDPAYFQYYLIDGFIASSNLKVESLATQDMGFVNTDHNPVLLQVTLR
jgi:endonuclease/exonuclease/phosphatase family metal-dependent hydrolase